MRCTPASLLGILACSSLFAACVDVEFDGAGGATGSSTTAAGGTSSVGGGSGVGAGATTSASTTSTATTTSGAGGSGGAPPCVPTTETCNQIDDDCDGLVDQPPTLVAGNFCGCDWTFNPSMGGRAYALCPTAGASFDAVPCPGGTSKVVFQTSTEQSFVSLWINAILMAGEAAYVGLEQTPGSTVGSGWAWLTSASGPGMVPQWNGGQPNDQDDLEPTEVEDGDQDCGAMYRGATSLPALHDQECVGAEYVLCEDSSPQACANGSCLLAAGCTGNFNCSLPEGQQCAPAPTSEDCNGEDDDCDGQVDFTTTSAAHACDCVSSTSPAGRDYKVCDENREFNEAHCGPGFKLVVIGGATEQAYIASLIGVSDYLIGLYQLTDAATPDARWFWPDGTALGATSWESTEPADGDSIENDARNCAHVVSAGWHDAPCGNPHPYICEEIP